MHPFGGSYIPICIVYVIEKKVVDVLVFFIAKKLNNTFGHHFKMSIQARLEIAFKDNSYEVRKFYMDEQRLFIVFFFIEN